MNTKKCFQCKETKSQEEFVKTTRDGYITLCKSCKRIQTRERVVQHREWRHKKFATDPAWRKKYRSRHEKDPVKDRCRARTRYHVGTGTVKKFPCIVCMNKDVVPHHPSYQNHLDVIWLCQLHHRRLHLGEYELYKVKDLWGIKWNHGTGWTSILSNRSY